jgi:hypothetical protein
MACIDFFMAIVDSLSIYARSKVIATSETYSEKFALTLAVLFFALRLVLFIPIIFFTLKLLFYTSKSGGKALYGLKLTVFILFVLFNIVGLGFLTDKGCTVMHTKIPSLETFTKMKISKHGFRAENNLQKDSNLPKSTIGYDDCLMPM